MSWLKSVTNTTRFNYRVLLNSVFRAGYLWRCKGAEFIGDKQAYANSRLYQNRYHIILTDSYTYFHFNFRLLSAFILCDYRFEIVSRDLLLNMHVMRTLCIRIPIDLSNNQSTQVTNEYDATTQLWRTPKIANQELWSLPLGTCYTKP